MKQIQIARAERVKGAETILQKCVGDVTNDAKEIDLEVFSRWTHCDFALELRGNRLWLWSVKVGP